MSRYTKKTPSLPSAEDRVDAGVMRRPIKSPARQITDLLQEPDTLMVGMMSSVGVMALFPQTWALCVPAALAYYALVSKGKYRLPFKVPQSWGGTDYGAPTPSNDFEESAGILYLGRDQQSYEELWIDNGDARRHGFFLGTTGSGKAMRLDEPILTPRGWVENGALRPGDEVCHPSGDVSRIESVHPQGEIQVLRIWFSDGRHADCSLDHLWHVSARSRSDNTPSVADGFGSEGRIMEARDIGLLHGVRGGDIRMAVPFSRPRDGCIPVPEGALVAREDLRAALEGPHGLAGLGRDFSLEGSVDQRRRFIADYVAVSGIEIRKSASGDGAILAGIPRKDATLLRRVAFSLGGQAMILVGELEDEVAALHACIPGMEGILDEVCGGPEDLEIVEVEVLDEKAPMSCIKTDREDGLYVAGDFIVTHNTELLMGICSQTLMWSSGFMFVDGKGTVEFYARVWALAKRFGREDDVRVLNFKDGGEDPDAPSGGPNVQSNTINPFAKGSADQLMNLIVSLMGDSGASGDMWKGRAMSLVTSAMKALCIMRDQGDILLDVQAIRDFLPLGQGVDKNLTDRSWASVEDISEEAWDEMRTRGGMIELYLRAIKGDFSNASRLALKSFFDSLPSFNLAKAIQGANQDPKTSEQYGYLAMQLTKPLGSLADDYGHIFRTPRGDVDITDIIINRRILIVLLPALDKAAEETQNCGKIIVSLVKNVMGDSSGSELTGSKLEIVDAKQTNSPSPYIIVFDEAGYYMVKGIDVIMAQARALGFMIIVAGQDMSSMQSIQNTASVAETAAANGSLFATGKTTDGSKTLDLVQKVFGKTQVSVTSGYQAKTGMFGTKMVDRMETSFQEVEKVRTDELQEMGQGEFYFLFNGTVVRSSTFFVGRIGKGGFADQSSVNKFLKVRGPLDRAPGLDQDYEEELLSGYLAICDTMVGAAKSDIAVDIPNDGLATMAERASNILWMAGDRAGRPENIHAAWIGACMSFSIADEEEDEESDWMADLEEVDMEGPVGDFEEARLGKPNGIAEGLSAAALGETPRDRHSGLVDVLTGQEISRGESIKTPDVAEKVREGEAQRRAEMAETRRSMADFFHMVAENSAKFAEIFSGDDDSIEVGMEILRRSGSIRTAPIDEMRQSSFISGAMSDLERLMIEDTEVPG